MQVKYHVIRLFLAFLVSDVCNKSFLVSASIVLARSDEQTNSTVPTDKTDMSNSYIVKFKSEDSYASFVDEIEVSMSNTRIINEGLPQLDTALMQFDSEEDAEMWALTRDDIEFVEKDIPVYPMGAMAEEEMSFSMMAETTPYGINSVNALGIPDYVTASGIKMCIIDSGYAVGHEDLPDPNKGDRVTGKSNLCGKSCDWKQDKSGHGTHVAGTIAAIGDNQKGVVGVVNHNNMPIHIVRVFDTDSTSTSNVVVAMYECEARGANVVNMSLGSTKKSSLFQPALDKILGRNDRILFIAAAGNAGDSSYVWPASMPEFVSVASLDNKKERSFFSQYNNQIDLAAPGSNILSTYPSNRYANFMGTSMAAPHVSAVAAKIWSHKPSMTAKQVRVLLESTAEDLGSKGRDNSFGWGMVDALAAYRVLVPPTPAPTKLPTRVPTNPPTAAPVTPPTSAPSSSAPSSSPSITTPSKPPSNNPSLSPSTIIPTATPCEDTPVSFSWNGKKKRCRNRKIAKDSKLCGKRRIKLLCPETCQACEYKLADASLPFYHGRGKMTTCEKLASLNPKQIEKKCVIPTYYKTCRKTCRTYLG